MSARPNKSLLAVFGAAILALTPVAYAQDAPVLVGTWSLNIDKTEPANDKVIEDERAAGTMRADPGGRGGGGARGNVRLTFGGMMMASKTLKVTQADSVVTIEDDDGPLFVNLRADNKTREEMLADRTVLKTRVQWRKNELLIHRSHPTDGLARMVIRVDEKNPKLLIVDFHYEHKGQRRTIDQRRFYEAGMELKTEASGIRHQNQNHP